MRIAVVALATLGLGLVATGQSAAAEFPTGTFTLTTKDGAAWAVAFTDKGKFTVSRNGAVAAEGSYRVTGDQIEVTDEKGPKAATVNKSGTYKWKLDGKKLTFTRVKDEAGGRAAVITAGAWEKKE
jgi:hypothetical protein